MTRAVERARTDRVSGILGLVAYNLEEIRPAADAWRCGLAGHLKRNALDAQEIVEWDLDHQAVCAHPDLLLGQTCGYPLRHALAGRVRVVATPVYAAMGCSSSTYSSAIVVREADPAQDLAALRGRVCAVNSSDSHSGYNVLRYHVSKLADGRPFFGGVVHTGAHVDSVAAVASARADVAAIDAVVWSLLERHRRSALDNVRVLAMSESAPALPYVTRASASRDTLNGLRASLEAAVADPALRPARRALLLDGFELVSDDAYECIDRFETQSQSLGYAALA